APIEGVRDALEKRAALMPNERAKMRGAIDARLWTALLVGDLAEAERVAREWDALYADSLAESDHVDPLGTVLRILEERDDTRALLDFADAYERRAATWTHREPPWPRIWIAYDRRHAKRIDEAAFQRRREELTGE